MKIRYTEQLLKDVIEQQIFSLPDVPEEVASFDLSHPVVAYLRKANGEKSLASCVLDADEHGILVILMGNFRADKAKGYQYFRFSNMQGIKVKKGLLNYKITLQFTDGTKYVFQVMKRSTKHLPNQNRNVTYIASTLHSQNLHNMKNTIHRKRVIKNKIISAIYIVTLVIFEIIALNLSINHISSSTLAIVVILATAVIHFILFVACGMYVDTRRDKHFKSEYNEIMQSYQKNSNAAVFLHELTHMKNKPKSTQAANAYYFNMSTALYKNDRKEEALSYLDAIVTTEDALQKAVAKQREDIEKGDVG